MATAEKLMTPDEFLEWESAQPERYEYVAGTISAMAGMSDEHNQLSTNLVVAFARRLKPPCGVRVEGLKVQLGAAFVYPDALILCQEPIFYNFRTDTIVNPTVIFEIISDSTEAFDRGEKFRRYRQLKGLETIVFVAQNEVLVECWTRVGDAWQVREYESREDTLIVAPVDVRVSLAELYDGITLR
jgi:Uma2 family endonuclease